MLNITAVGNLATDPRSNTVGQTDVTNFTILVNKKMKDQEYVTAVDCAVWGARAAVAAQYLTKGDRVTVAGDAHAETFERKDGSAACKIVLRVTDFTLPARPAQQAAPAEAEMAF
jgi:single-stranded DNA-binding protein